jgi:hypothetical protein
LKVKVINEKGIVADVSPDNIVVGGLTLKQILDKLTKLENEVTRKFTALEKREKTLQEAVRKL